MKWHTKLMLIALITVLIVLVYCASCYLWQTLEIIVDGQIHTSNADTIINILITYFITKDKIKECLGLICK